MNRFTGASARKPLGRFAAVSFLLARHALLDILELLLGRRGRVGSRGEAEELLPKSRFPTPRRIRLALQDLGPTFIKMGQLMSTRADIFPPEYIEEFKKLQDRVPPEPFSEIQRLMEKQLKGPIDKIFAEFNSEPVAAASVAQVHVAKLFNHEKVAVKVVRPGIGKKIREDIRLMRYLAEKIEKNLEVGRIVGATELVSEFERTIFKELDMLVEAGNMEKFHKNFEGSTDIHIPKVYWDYTTKSLLVMEHIDGIKMDQVELIRSHGIDPKRIALIGLHSFSRQLMEFGLFHADPHPGNTIVMYDGRVALVDFGITGYLDEETMRQVASIFLGYARHDYQMVMDALWEAGLINERTMELGNFKADLEDMSECFYGRSLKTISVKEVYDQVMRLVLKYRIRLPRILLLLLKTFVQTEALGKILQSDASILQVTRPYAQRLIERESTPGRTLSKMRKDGRILGNQIKTMPKFVQHILRQMAEGKQRLELLHGGFQDLDTQIEKAVNRLTVGMIICASIIGGAVALNSSEKIVELPIQLLGVQTVSLTAILGVAGYAIATVLGLLLIISIFRSGKL